MPHLPIDEIVDVAIWAAIAILVLFALIFLVIDMFGRVEWLLAKAPKLERLLERRTAFGVLLLVAIGLEIAIGTELYTKEIPPLPPPLQVVLNAPPPPIVKFIEQHPNKETPIDKPAPNRAANTAPNPSTPQGPIATPQPAAQNHPNPPPAIIPTAPTKSAYEMVSQALINAQNINLEWSRGMSYLTGRIVKRRAGFYPPLTQQEIDDMANDFATDVSKQEDLLKSQWQFALPQIQSACAAATGMIRKQVNPEAATEESRACDGAVDLLETEPSRSDLRDDARDSLNGKDAQNTKIDALGGRYGPLVSYLSDLQAKLAKYKENP
jgi:hypothetical protein